MLPCLSLRHQPIALARNLCSQLVRQLCKVRYGGELVRKVVRLLRRNAGGRQYRDGRIDQEEHQDLAHASTARVAERKRRHTVLVDVGERDAAALARHHRSERLVERAFVAQTVHLLGPDPVVLLVLGLLDRLAKVQARLGDVVRRVVVDAAGNDALVAHAFDVPHAAGVPRVAGCQHNVGQLDNHLQAPAAQADVVRRADRLHKVADRGLDRVLALLIVVRVHGIGVLETRADGLQQVRQRALEHGHKALKDACDRLVQRRVLPVIKVVDVRLDRHSTICCDVEVRWQPLIRLGAEATAVLRRWFDWCAATATVRVA
jgi:hypothetical protein